MDFNKGSGHFLGLNLAGDERTDAVISSKFIPDGYDESASARIRASRIESVCILNHKIRLCPYSRSILNLREWHEQEIHGS